MSKLTASLADTIVNFYDNYVPKLKDGQYTITLSQTVTADNPGIPTTPQQAVKQSFLVNGPRFSLPPTDVNHVFPPAGNTGVYSTYLPQVVMNEQMLPWERNLELKTTNPNVPWMALMVFGEGELPGPQPPPPAGTQQNPTLFSSGYINNVVVSSFNKIKTTGPPAGTLGPTLTLEANEDPNQIQCNYIDIPVATFNAICPNVADATFLAHTRQVSLANKVLVPGQTGFFSAVIANRFAVAPTAPATQNTNIVHLVSLEGFETYLQNGQPNVNTSDYNFVRMVSLYSWTYTVQANPAQDFSQLMLNLLPPLPFPTNAPNPLLLYLPPPVAPTNTSDATVVAIENRLQAGYVPLSYQMQSGDQTFAWYRGPFSPVPVTRFMEYSTTGPNTEVPFSTADAMIFDPATGVFDQSYAVAFQTGRSLALGSQAFATSLVSWRKTCYGVVDLIMEYMTSPAYSAKMLSDGLIDKQGNLTATGITDLAQLLSADVITGAFTDFFATEFYQNLATSIGKEGGFTTADSQAIIQEAPQVSPAEPASLLALMQQPVIVNLLQQLSGFDNLGTISAVLNPGATSITLNSPGAYEALSAGLELILYSPDGTTSAWVTLAADVPANATILNIVAYSGTTPIPVNSSVQVQDADQDAQSLVNWLANTALLYNVPFNNLVANPNMLPQESIRFFYVDQNWTDALLDGALSIGIQSSRDALFNQLMRNPLYEAVQSGMAEVRDQLLGVASQGHTPGIVQPAGFLLRSQNIANYPGLQITAQSAGGSPMQPLRLNTLANDLVIAIYPDVPTQVAFTQPSEGLVFGIEAAQGIELRYIPGMKGYTATNIGTVTDGWVTPQTMQGANRTGTNPAMNIAGSNGLVSIIETALGNSVTLSPASFAVEMVCVPQQMLFNPLTS